MRDSTKALAFVFTSFIPIDPVFSKEIEGAFRCDIENIYLLVKVALE